MAIAINTLSKLTLPGSVLRLLNEMAVACSLRVSSGATSSSPSSRSRAAWSSALKRVNDRLLPGFVAAHGRTDDTIKVIAGRWLDTLIDIAAALDASPTHVAIAWLREKARRSTTALIPILGSRTREQLDATLGALNVQLSIEQMARLDGVSDVAKGVPHESISGSFARFSGGQILDLPIIPVA